MLKDLRTVFAIAFNLVALLGGNGVAQEPAVVEVAPQPLSSNVRRLAQALVAIGHPLPRNVSGEITAAIAAQDAAKIQNALDPHVLAVVTINPEQRVSVKRGPAAASLQQAGYRPLLIKIVNHSTSTSRLRVTSPQAGPVYAGTAELSMRRQQQLPLLENQNVDGSQERFLGIEMYRDPPMTPQMSGLEVEYAIVLIAASESGKREGVLHFDIGDGTADLEHRNELPVLFTIEPALPLKLSIRDHDGSPGMARLEFRDAHGRVYPLQAKRVMPDFFFQSHVYRIDGETVLLPPGEFDVQSSRGPEYVVQRSKIEMVEDADNELELNLERWFDAADYGFYSGDHHIHAAGCRHYTQPSEGVSPADMFRQVRGEGLNVGCVLTWGPCFEFQRQYFNAEADLFGTVDTLLKYDLEISGFGSQALGHVCLLNLSDQTYPESDGTKTKGWPTWTTPVMRWAKEQGGYAGYAHSASGLHIDPESASERLLARYDQDQDDALEPGEVDDALLPGSFHEIDSDRDGRITAFEMMVAHRKAAERLPNHAIPEMNGVGAMEICVSSVAGVCDFISAMDTRRIQEWNTWYHLLNCGFPLKVSGETDFPCMSSRRVGKGRVYVDLGEDAKLDFAAWCKGLAAGRSYVSDGYAHVPVMKVDGVSPGFGEVNLAQPGDVTLIAQVAFAPQVPEAVAYGTRESESGRAVTGDTVLLHGDRSDRWVVGGVREVEVIVNGLPVATRTVPADGHVHEIEVKIPIEQSSWIAIRQFPQLHSNPVNVIVDGLPIRASRQSARWCVEMTELLWKNRQQKIAEGERDEAKQAFDHAIDVLKTIAKESKSVWNENPKVVDRLSSKLDATRPMNRQRIQFTSTADGSEQEAYLILPDTMPANATVPLVVSLHSWSANMEQRNVRLEGLVHDRGWIYLFPNFRGANKTPAACGSPLAQQDILDAVDWTIENHAADPKRVYLTGNSGGGHMTMLMAARYPDRWKAASAWVGISDLMAWHRKHQGSKYGDMMEKCCGGAPGDSPQVDLQYQQRSPLTYLAAAKNVAIDIAAGVHDGHKGSVPIRHSIEAFNAIATARGDAPVSETEIEQLSRKNGRLETPTLADTGSDPTFGRDYYLRRQSGRARLTIFEGGHEGIATAAMAWFDEH